MKTLAVALLLLAEAVAMAQPDPEPAPVEEPPAPPPPAPATPPPPPATPVTPTPPTPPPAPVARDPRAAQLTTTAERAALHGDCVAVRMLAKRVNELDPAYFVAAFVTNPVITGCRSGVQLDARADVLAGVAGPQFGTTGEIGIGGGMWTGDGLESLSGPGGPSFGFGSFVTPKVALTFRVAGATHIGADISGYVGFAGPSLQVWLDERAFLGGGIGLGIAGFCGGDDCAFAKGFGMDLRGGYAFHPSGYSGGNVSAEITTTSIDGFTLKTFSILLGYQSF